MSTTTNTTTNLNELFNNSLTHVFKSGEYYGFSGSSLPYCGIRDFLTVCKKGYKCLPEKENSFKRQLDMDIGTDIHELLQRALAEKGMLYGDWECTSQFGCSHITQNSYGPVKCAKCGWFTKYAEFTVKYGKFSGRVDALIPAEEGIHNNRFRLVDFKIVDTKKLLNKSSDLEASHRLQVLSYCYALKRPPYNMDIVSQHILYINRENISQTVLIDIPQDEFADMEFERFIKQKDISDDAVRSGDFSKIKYLCSSREDSPFCPYGGICFSPAKEELLKAEWTKYTLAGKK